MKQYVPLIVVGLAIITALFTIFGDGNYSKLSQLRASIESQKEKNDVLRSRIDGLQKQVDGLQQDDRELEKAARNELGMARPNELIFLFDDEKNKKAK